MTQETPQDAGAALDGELSPEDRIEALKGEIEQLRAEALREGAALYGNTHSQSITSASFNDVAAANGCPFRPTTESKSSNSFSCTISLQGIG